MRVIELDVNNRVVSVGETKTVPEGMIESSEGEIGQVMLEDGTFEDYIPTAEEQSEIDKRKRIEELKKVIPEKQLCGIDVSTEQAELAQLLGY